MNQRVVPGPAFEVWVAAGRMRGLGQNGQAATVAVAAVVVCTAGQRLLRAMGCPGCAMEHPPAEAQMVEEVRVQICDAPHFVFTNAGALPVVAAQRHVGRACIGRRRHQGHQKCEVQSEAAYATWFGRP